MYVIRADHVQTGDRVQADRVEAGRQLALRPERRWRLGDSLASAMGSRARWALMGLAAAALLGAGYAREAAVSPLVTGPVPAASETVMVAPGDTLWGIASRRYPGDDVRQKVFEIEKLNGLGGPTI